MMKMPPKILNRRKLLRVTEVMRQLLSLKLLTSEVTQPSTKYSKTLNNSRKRSARAKNTLEPMPSKNLPKALIKKTRSKKAKMNKLK